MYWHSNSIQQGSSYRPSHWSDLGMTLLDIQWGTLYLLGSSDQWGIGDL